MEELCVGGWSTCATSVNGLPTIQHSGNTRNLNAKVGTKKIRLDALNSASGNASYRRTSLRLLKILASVVATGRIKGAAAMVKQNGDPPPTATPQGAVESVASQV